MSTFFKRLKETAVSSKEHVVKITVSWNQTNMIELMVVKLRLWSLLVLPILGFLAGQLLQFVFRTKSSSAYESLLVHGLTMVFMIATFNEILFNTEGIKDLREKALFVCIAYLFVLAAVLGIVVPL